MNCYIGTLRYKDHTLQIEPLLFRVNALLPRTLTRFSMDGGVETLAFSSKSDMMAVTSRKGRAQLIELPSFRRLYEESCLQSASATFRPDGEMIAIACGPGTIQIIDTQRAAVVLDIPVPGEVTGLMYSPDGKHLAVRSDKRVFLLDAESGRIRVSIVHDAPVEFTQIAFSEDSHWLATASGQNPVNIFETTTGNRVSTLAMPPHYTFDFAHPRILKFASGNRLFVALNSGPDPARIWSFTKSGQPTGSAAVDRIILPVSAMMFEARTGSWLYAGMDHRGEAVDLEQSRYRMNIPIEGIKQIALAGKKGNDPQVLTVQRDGTARLWKASETKPEYSEYRRIVQEAPIVTAAIDPQGELAATADSLGNVQVSDIRIAREEATHYHPGQVGWNGIDDQWGPSLSPTGTYIVRQLSHDQESRTDSEPHEVQVIRSADMTTVGRLPTSDTLLLDVAFSPGEDMIAWTSNIYLKIASTKTWKTLRTIQIIEFKEEFSNVWVRFLGDGAHLLIVRFNHHGNSQLQLWDTNTGRRLAQRDVIGRVTVVEESRRRKEIAIGVEITDTNGSVYFFNEDSLLSETRRTEGLQLAPALIRYSDDGRYVGMLLRLAPGPKYLNTAMEFVPKLPQYEDSVEVQDAKSGNSLLHLNSDGGFLGLAFSEDSKTLRIAHRFIGPVAVLSQEWSGADLVELPSGRKIDEAHSPKMRYLKFGSLSRNGRWMIGVDRETGESSLINLFSGTQTFEVGERSIIEAGSFSDDGRIVLDVLADKRLRVRRLDVTGQVEGFCAAAPGNPSPDEWRKWMGSVPYQKICPE